MKKEEIKKSKRWSRPTGPLSSFIKNDNLDTITNLQNSKFPTFKNHWNISIENKEKEFRELELEMDLYKIRDCVVVLSHFSKASKDFNPIRVQVKDSIEKIRELESIYKNSIFIIVTYRDSLDPKNIRLSNKQVYIAKLHENYVNDYAINVHKGDLFVEMAVTSEYATTLLYRSIIKTNIIHEIKKSLYISVSNNEGNYILSSKSHSSMLKDSWIISTNEVLEIDPNSEIKEGVIYCLSSEIKKLPIDIAFELTEGKLEYNNWYLYFIESAEIKLKSGKIIKQELEDGKCWISKVPLYKSL